MTILYASNQEVTTYEYSLVVITHEMNWCHKDRYTAWLASPLLDAQMGDVPLG
jgi:hypothetical protein